MMHTNRRVSMENGKSKLRLVVEMDELDVQEDILESLGAGNLRRERAMYPIISTNKNLKNFSKRYRDFWKRLISECPKDMLLDDYLLETLLSWLISISLYVILCIHTL